MKKKIFILVMIVCILALSATEIIKPETTKYPIKGRASAAIYMTSVYKSDYWAEFFLTYEEDNDSYDEAISEKHVYEFISKYKVTHKFSTVEVEEVKAAEIGSKTTTVVKRIIFRQVRK